MSFEELSSAMLLRNQCEIRRYARSCVPYAMAMGILKNRRLEIFAQGLALGKDTYSAAADAGYNQNARSFEANARQRASFPEVKARIRELQERAIEKTTVDLAWIMGQLVEMVIHNEAGAMTDAQRATEAVIAEADAREAGASHKLIMVTTGIAEDVVMAPRAKYPKRYILTKPIIESPLRAHHRL